MPLMSLHTKMAMSDSQRYPWNRYLINNAEDIVVFLGLKMFHSKNFSMFSCSKKAPSHFCREITAENNQFTKS